MKLYVWNNTKKQIVINKEVEASNSLILILEVIDDLEIVDYRVYTVLSIE